MDDGTNRLAAEWTSRRSSKSGDNGYTPAATKTAVRRKNVRSPLKMECLLIDKNAVIRERDEIFF